MSQSPAKSASAAAQDIPKETRKGLAQQLQVSFAVFREKVQEDLKMLGKPVDLSVLFDL